MGRKQESFKMPFKVDKDVIAFVHSLGSYRAAAKKLNLSATYLHKVGSGQQRPSPKLAALAGWKRAITWTKEPLDA
jgi:hypothetical protein